MNSSFEKSFKLENLSKKEVNLTNYLDTSFFVQQISKRNENNVFLVCANSYQANKIFSFLSLFKNEASILLFPEEEILYASTYSSSSDLLAQRLSTLISSFEDGKKIIVTTAIGFCRFLPSPKFFKSNFIHIKKGNTLDIKKSSEILISMGYRKVSHVSQTFEFAVRGDLIDIFSINSEYPIRVSIYDDKVEFISFFRIETQLTFKKTESFIVYPASDIIFEKDEQINIFKILEKEQINSEDLSYKEFDIFNQNNYKYYSSCQKENFSILDYFKDAIIIFNDYKECVSNYDNFKKMSENYLLEYKKNVSPKQELSLVHDFSNVEKKCRNIIKTYLNELLNESDFFPNKIIDLNLNKLEFLFKFIKNSKMFYKRIAICVENHYQLELIEKFLKVNNFFYSVFDSLNFDVKTQFSLCIFPLFESFELIGESTLIISCSKIFGLKKRRSLIKNKFKRGIIINSYEEIIPGDYLVHENYGIGQFVDICTLDIDNKKSDYLKIKYARNQVLYVPLNQFKLVRRYRGSEGFEPKLNSLNDSRWVKTKALAEERSVELSKKLKSLYKKRASLKGHKFNVDDDIQKEFEADFPYDLTDDQAKSIKSIKEEMEDGKLIDYLVCGDVGFGKTEVALRAIFKTILNGYQVALLCPTTVLAKQHFLVAQERFEKYGAKVELFSRLISGKKKNIIIENLKNGLVDLIIGTHSLLSNKVEFKNLGLLVIDEEQRFGVEQKEKIKSLKADINVITLSATPIPRTLELSLSGIRDISIINTPPKERSPVQTYVLPYRKEIIKELITRELNRDGQIYYVYNDVETIMDRAHFISDLVPFARIGILHGQMDKNDIDKTLLDFFDGKINLLICSSIIENGLDVQNANLLIVENSDLFGLSQLYQIKGRIGRGNRIGYAYLTYDDNRTMSKNGRERLKAIQEFTELGSGYKIAQKDLIIRGAGNIFGKEQAGFIDALGIDLYFQIINNAIKIAKEQKPIESKNRKINIEVEGYFDDSFVNKKDKIDLYNKILNCSSINEVDQVEKEIKDIYGRIPDTAKNIFLKRKVECILENDFVEKIQNKETEIMIIFKKNSLNVINEKYNLNDLIDESEDNLSVYQSLKYIEVKLIKGVNWIEKLYEILRNLLKILNIKF